MPYSFKGILGYKQSIKVTCIPFMYRELFDKNLPTEVRMKILADKHKSV
jgi:hypothetical protein